VTYDDAPRATDEQIKKASNLLKRIDLKKNSLHANLLTQVNSYELIIDNATLKLSF